MKRLLIILSAIVLLAACQKDVSVDAVATLTYTLVPNVSFEVKSEAQSTVNTTVNSLTYKVYHKKGENDYRYVNEMSSHIAITDPSDIKVPISLIKDQEYLLVFIAQYRFELQQRTQCYAYMYDTDNGKLSVNQEAPFTSGEQLEAYVCVDAVGPISGSENKKITLDRIVSQINIHTSSQALPNKLNINASGAPAWYNVFEREFSSEPGEINLENIDISGDVTEISGNEHTRLATLYCLGNNKLGLTLTNAEDEDKNFILNNITTKVNYKTNISGDIVLSSNN